MADTTQIDMDEVVVSLRKAIKDCSDRTLYFAAKWCVQTGSATLIFQFNIHLHPFICRASELLLSIPEERRKRSRTRSRQRRAAAAATPDFDVDVDLDADAEAEADLEEDEQDVLAAARAYADAKEFMRASSVLKECKSAKGRFMDRYFEFLVCVYFAL